MSDRDIVERLRDVATIYDDERSLRDEAAAEIERLRERVEWPEVPSRQVLNAFILANNGMPNASLRIYHAMRAAQAAAQKEGKA